MKFNDLFAEYGYSLLLQNSKNKWRAFRPVFLAFWGRFSRQSSGLVDLKNKTTKNVCSFTKRKPAKRQNKRMYNPAR